MELPLATLLPKVLVAAVKVTLWIETTDDATEADAEAVAIRALADLGVRLAAMAHVDEGFTLSLRVRPTMDMPGTWLADVELP